jgi:hypothetical protein
MTRSAAGAGGDGVDTRSGSVVADCAAADLAPLGYAVADLSDDWRRLDDPRRRANRSFQIVPDPTPGKNELHLDLYPRDQRGEVERLKGIGATVHRLPGPGDDFVARRDPGAT